MTRVAPVAHSRLKLKGLEEHSQLERGACAGDRNQATCPETDLWASGIQPEVGVRLFNGLNRGRGPLMGRIARSIMLVGTLMVAMAGNAFGTTHYIAANGSDTNNGTSESTPWAHLPGMATCASNCASYTPAAGDIFILRGCDDFPNADFPIRWTWSGTSANPILIEGNGDTSWYNTSSCSAWNRPIFDAGGTDIGGAGGCGGLGANWFLYLNTVTYVTFNWIEAKGLYWNNNQQGSCFRTVGFAIGNASDHIILNDWYMHHWTHGTSAGTTDVGSGGMIASYNTTPDCGNCVVENSVMDNSDSPDGASCATGGSLCSGGGVSSWSSENNIFFDVVEAIDTSNYVSTDVTIISGNNISNLQASFTTPSQGGSAPHPNCIETLFGGSTYYIYNNYIHNIFTCEGGQVGNPGEVDYVWNNVWDMGASGVGGENGPQVPQSTSGSKTLFFVNNTVRWATGCINVGGHSTTYTGTFAVQNNHCINDSSVTVAGATPGGATISNNLGMTNAMATSQGYTATEQYEFQPASSCTVGTCSTVGAGLDLASLIPAGFTANDTNYACTEQTVSGVVESVCPARIANQRLGSWDVGAYEFSSSSANQPNPPTGLAASVQ